MEPHSDGLPTDEAEVAVVTRSQARKISDEAQNPDVPTVRSEEDEEPREPLVQGGVWEPSKTNEWYTKLLEAVQIHSRCHPQYQSRQRIGGELECKLCIPLVKIPNVIHDRSSWCSYSRSTGGEENVGLHYVWHGWRHQVKQYVRACGTCQEYKVL